MCRALWGLHSYPGQHLLVPGPVPKHHGRSGDPEKLLSSQRLSSNRGRMPTGSSHLWIIFCLLIKKDIVIRNKQNLPLDLGSCDRRLAEMPAGSAPPRACYSRHRASRRRLRTSPHDSTCWKGAQEPMTSFGKPCILLAEGAFPVRDALPALLRPESRTGD